jgi:hypothetical protein
MARPSAPGPSASWFSAHEASSVDRHDAQLLQIDRSWHLVEDGSFGRQPVRMAVSLHPSNVLFL